MIQSTTTPTTRSSKAFREALRHLSQIVAEDASFSVSIDGLPEFKVQNKLARHELLEAIERAIQIEITEIAIDEADAGKVIPIEDIESALQNEQDV